MMHFNSKFKPAWWLSHAHAQTLYPTLSRRIQAPIDRVERLELSDGDFIDLAWVQAGLPASAPLVLLLHGLGGGVNSSYISGQLQVFRRKGWRAVVMHFRGASADPNRLARAYHSGDTADFQYLVETLVRREPDSKKAAVGFSLGGNVLLKWLGEQGEQPYLQACVAVSVPYELELVTDKLNRGFSRVYQTYLLRKLQGLYGCKVAAYPQLFPKSFPELKTLRTIRAFDEQITAPFNGFADAAAYYRASSSRQYLKNIAAPTLLIHSLDDPFMNPSVIPRREELSPCTSLELSRKGGHVGFVSSDALGKVEYWLDQRIPEFLETLIT